MRRLAAALAALCLCLTACPDADQRAERARSQAREALARGERDTALDAIASLERVGGDTPEAIRERATLLIQAGEAPAVVWLLEDAVARFPDASALRLLLAQTALLVNDPTRADRVAAEIPSDGDDAGAALVVRARAALALGDLDAALERFRRAEQGDPTRPELRIPRIAALLAEGRFDAADRALAEARAQVADPDAALLASLELALLQYRVTDARQQLQRAERGSDPAAAAQAREALRAALEAIGARAQADPSQLGAWQVYVYGMLASGRAEEASGALEAALAEDPERLALLPLLAHARLARADRTGAEQALRDLAKRGTAAAALPDRKSVV